MKRLLRATTVALLSTAMLTLTACGPAYEGTVKVAEKDNGQMFVMIGKTRTLKNFYKINLCPEEAFPESTHAAEECFWESVTRNEFMEINVGDVMTYSGRSIQK